MDDGIAQRVPKGFAVSRYLIQSGDVEEIVEGDSFKDAAVAAVLKALSEADGDSIKLGVVTQGIKVAEDDLMLILTEHVMDAAGLKMELRDK